MTDDDGSPRVALEELRDDPEDVAVGEVVSHLAAEDEAVRKAAADVLYEAAKDEPARLAEGEAVSELVATLDDADPLVRESVALALAEVAEATDALVPVADAVVARLDDDYDIVTDNLAYVLRTVAETAPEELVDAVPELRVHLDADLASTRFHVLSALVGIAAERPERVRPVIDSLFEVIERRDPEIGRSGARTPSETAGDRGSVGASGTAEDAEFVGSGHSEARPETAQPGTEPGMGADHETTDIEAWIVEAALTVLATMAAERPADTATRLGSRVPRLRGLLDDPHAGIRSVTAGTLAAIAEYEPEAVAPATEELADRLTDDATVVAGNAVWALRYLDTPRSRATLREADPAHDDVQAVIDAALADLDE